MTAYAWPGAALALILYLQLGWTWADVSARAFWPGRRLSRRRVAGIILAWPLSMLLACVHEE